MIQLRKAWSSVWG